MRRILLSLVCLLLLPASLSAQTFRPRIMSGLHLTMLPGQTDDPLRLINSSGVVLALLNPSGRFEVAVLTNAGACTDGVFSLAAVIDGTLCVDTSADELYFRTGGVWFAINPAGGGGITTLNGLSAASQSFTVGTAGTDFAVSSAGSVHTFDLPDASATARGLVTTVAQTFGGTKTTPTWNATTGFQVGGAALNFSHLSGSATDAQVPNTITLDNITQITTRNFSSMQGTVSDSQLANNYGGVGACGANQFETGDNDNAPPTCVQPSFSNLSGSGTLSQLPFGTANQILGTNSAATAQEHKTLSVGTSGTDFNIAHAAGSIVFNLPNASPTNRGVVSIVTQSFVGQKTFTGNLIANLAFQVTNNEAQFLAGLQVTGVAQIPSLQSPNVTGDLAVAIVAGNGIGANEAGGLITLQTGTGNGTGAGGNLLIQPGDHGGSGSVPGVVDFNLPADSGLSIRESGAASTSTVGLIRLPWNRFIFSRNSTNTANIQILGIDTASGTNEVWVGDQGLGVGMQTESIKVVSDATIGDDLFIGTASDGWVFNNVSLPGSLVLIEMPPTGASGGEMSLLGQVISPSESTIRQIWRGGFYESAPSTGLTNIPLPVADQCAAGISVQRVSIVAITKGSGTMTFNVTRYNSAGSSQGNIFSSSQTYSNTGNNRQDFTANTTTATANDYFRFNIVTLNGQADVTFIVEGRCDDI